MPFIKRKVLASAILICRSAQRILSRSLSGGPRTHAVEVRRIQLRNKIFGKSLAIGSCGLIGGEEGRSEGRLVCQGNFHVTLYQLTQFRLTCNRARAEDDSQP